MASLGDDDAAVTLDEYRRTLVPMRRRQQR